MNNVLAFYGLYSVALHKHILIQSLLKKVIIIPGSLGCPTEARLSTKTLSKRDLLDNQFSAVPVFYPNRLQSRSSLSTSVSNQQAYASCSSRLSLLNLTLVLPNKRFPGRPESPLKQASASVSTHEFCTLPPSYILDRPGCVKVNLLKKVQMDLSAMDTVNQPNYSIVTAYLSTVPSVRPNLTLVLPNKRVSGRPGTDTVSCILYFVVFKITVHTRTKENSHRTFTTKCNQFFSKLYSTTRSICLTLSNKQVQAYIYHLIALVFRCGYEIGISD